MGGSDNWGTQGDDRGFCSCLVGERKRAYFRLGSALSRSRNGAFNMHAASCIAAVIGAWRYVGGGAFHHNDAIFHLDKSLIEGKDARRPENPDA